jgi:hypothetical protein
VTIASSRNGRTCPLPLRTSFRHPAILVNREGVTLSFKGGEDMETVFFPGPQKAGNVLSHTSRMSP